MRLISPTLLILMLILAACTSASSGSPSASPDASPSQAAVGSPTPAPDVEADGTLTLGDFGIADGPGESVESALANGGAEPRLVNGILLKDADGSVWLCESLAASSPPECEASRLLVTNYPPDHEVVNGEDYFSVFARDVPAEMARELHEEDGVRWVENQQLFGVVAAAQ
jgi:hypothetical protein